MKKKNAKSRSFTSSDVIHSFDWKSALEHDGGV